MAPRADSSEREAERTADQVIHSSGLDTQPLRLQRFPASDARDAEAPPIVHEVLKSPGHPLDPGTRAFMESRFGHDFSKVRIHNSPRAAESAAAVHALAYTVGSDIVFGSGQHRPDTMAGRRLLAHELTHTLQGAAGAAGPSPLQRQPDPRPAESTDVKVEFNAFIPGSLGTWLPEPLSSQCEFKTDVRGFGQVGTSRIHTEGMFTVGPNGIAGARSSTTIGASHQRCRVQLPSRDEFGVRDPNADLFRGLVLETSRTAPNNGSTSAASTQCSAHFDFIGEASYPFSLVAPDLDFDVDVDVRRAPNGIDVRFSGTHDEFPAYEGIVEIAGRRTIVHRYMPSSPGPTLLNLNSSIEIPDGTHGAFDIATPPTGCPTEPQEGR